MPFVSRFKAPCIHPLRTTLNPCVRCVKTHFARAKTGSRKQNQG